MENPTSTEIKLMDRMNDFNKGSKNEIVFKNEEKLKILRSLTDSFKKRITMKDNQHWNVHFTWMRDFFINNRSPEELHTKINGNFRYRREKILGTFY